MNKSVAVIEDDNEIEIILGGENTMTGFTSVVAEQNDPFDLKEADILKMSGLNPNLKRKVSRDISKAYTGTGGAASKQQEYMTNLGYYKFGVVTPPYNLDYLAKLYEVSAPHKAAVDAKVSNIVGLGYSWIESTKTQQALQGIQGDAPKLVKARAKIEKLKDQLDDWLDSCNEEDTFTEILRKVWTDYEVTGNGYLEVGRTVSGKIGYIGHIPSATMRVRSERDGFVQVIGKEITFFKHFGSDLTGNPVGVDTRPNEVIHFKKYSPVNSYYGVPDIMAAKNALAGAEFAARFNLDYFEYKAVPRYIITVKGATLSPASENRLIEFFQTGLKGKNHRTMYVPLPPGDNVEFKMEPVESSNQESSFNEYKKACRDEILMAHRVPIGKVSVTDISLAASRDADKTFKESVCRPEQRIAEKRLNRVTLELTDALKMKLNELTLTDELEQAKIDQIYLMTQVIVPNEVRQRKGLPGLEDGDKPFVLKPQDAAEKTAQVGSTRTRDQQRNAGATDSIGEARNAQGEGRSTD